MSIWMLFSAPTVVGLFALCGAHLRSHTTNELVPCTTETGQPLTITLSLHLICSTLFSVFIVLRQFIVPTPSKFCVLVSGSTPSRNSAKKAYFIAEQSFIAIVLSIECFFSVTRFLNVRQVKSRLDKLVCSQTIPFFAAIIIIYWVLLLPAGIMLPFYYMTFVVLLHFMTIVGTSLHFFTSIRETYTNAMLRQHFPQQYNIAKEELLTIVNSVLFTVTASLIAAIALIVHTGCTIQSPASTIGICIWLFSSCFLHALCFTTNRKTMLSVCSCLENLGCQNYRLCIFAEKLVVSMVIDSRSELNHRILTQHSSGRSSRTTVNLSSKPSSQGSTRPSIPIPEDVMNLGIEEEPKMNSNHPPPPPPSRHYSTEESSAALDLDQILPKRRPPETKTMESHFNEKLTPIVDENMNRSLTPPIAAPGLRRSKSAEKVELDRRTRPAFCMVSISAGNPPMEEENELDVPMTFHNRFPHSMPPLDFKNLEEDEHTPLVTPTNEGGTKHEPPSQLSSVINQMQSPSNISFSAKLKSLTLQTGSSEVLTSYVIPKRMRSGDSISNTILYLSTHQSTQHDTPLVTPESDRREESSTFLRPVFPSVQASQTVVSLTAASRAFHSRAQESVLLDAMEMSKTLNAFGFTLDETCHEMVESGNGALVGVSEYSRRGNISSEFIDVAEIST